MTKQEFILQYILRNGSVTFTTDSEQVLSAQAKASIDALAAIYDYTETLCSNKEQEAQSLLSTNILELPFSSRLCTCLRVMGIHTVGDICNTTRRDIMSCANLGRKSLEELDIFMENNKLFYKD